ncbi:MAG TPA: hypothetical protein VG406_28205 [Isosphaeraceae bacterium]|nr:hypothetical protein [Isosphaeraceae bacterium]
MRRSLGIAVVGLVVAAWAVSASAQQVTVTPAPGAGARVTVGQPAYTPMPGVTRYYSSGYQGMTVAPAPGQTMMAAPTMAPVYPQTYTRQTYQVRQRGMGWRPFRRWRMRRTNRWYSY